MNKENIEELIIDEGGEDSPFTIYPKEIKQTTYNVYITDEIEKHSDWFKLMNKLRTAEATDRFVLYLNNFGGAVNVGLQLIHAMKESPADIITAVDGNCYSMGSIICLASDMMIWSGTSSRLMFHNCSGGHSGKAKETLDAVINSNDAWRDALIEYTTPFLTEDEIEAILEDKDVYCMLDGKEECVQRCKRHFEAAKSIYKVGKQYAPNM